MAELLSQEWIDRAREALAALPERPGASARIQHVVVGGPDGDVTVRLVVSDGRLVESGPGPTDDADIDVTMTTTYADTLLLAAGDLEPSAAVMQGRAKVAGDVRALIAVLPVTHTPAFRAALASLR
jgi:hypothetical protein